MLEKDRARCLRVLEELIRTTQEYLGEIEAGAEAGRSERALGRLDDLERHRALRFAVLERSEPDPTDPEIQSRLRQLYTLDERLIPMLRMYAQKLKVDLARHRRLSQVLEKMRATGAESWPR